jgi:hypothetical protein
MTFTWRYVYWAIAIEAAVILLCALIGPAGAQEHHAEGHTHYQSWVNQNGQGCCNDQDCGALADQNERTVSGKLEVRIEGEWCPVKPRHYLKQGNAPNWSTAHVCVRKAYSDEYGTTEPESPCDRLLCYQPKPSF